MNQAITAAGAIAFLWLGMVLAISFVETPLKFRAPGVTIPIGLGIGRIVFRALNTIEGILAAALVATVLVGHAGIAVTVAATVVVVLLIGQVSAVRPSLNQRSNEVLTESDRRDSRSRAHVVYVTLEVLKVVGLTATGILALAS